MRIFSTNIIQPFFFTTKKTEAKPTRLQPAHIGLNADVITFCGKKPVKKPLNPKAPPLHVNFSTLKEIKDLTCVYCGVTMINPSLKYELTEKIAASTGKDLIAALTRGQKYLYGWKNNIATEIMNLANIYPDENIQNLMWRLVDNYKFELKNKQLNVCSNIRQKYENSFATKTEKKLFDLLLDDTEKWVTGKNKFGPFERKLFLYELSQILCLPIFRNKHITKQILKDAEAMPNSFESASAFVVKYYKRSPREIAEQLFYERTPTLEHIKPQIAGGTRDPQNITIACAKCNNTVRRSMPLSAFADIHPEIIDNIRKNFRTILLSGEETSGHRKLYGKVHRPGNDRCNYELNNPKRTSQNRQYVSAIAKTIERESKGKIPLKEFIID